MKLSGYGIQLEPLNLETAELLRQWRNSPRILEQMEYQETITPEMQVKWFASLRGDQFQYFIVYTKDMPIGMIHLSHIDKTNKEAEAGLFIGEERFSGTGVALGASILLLDYAFGILGLERVFAKVKSGNIPAEKYDALLGFEKWEELPTGFNRWVLKRSKYYFVKDSLVKLMV